MADPDSPSPPPPAEPTPQQQLGAQTGQAVGRAVSDSITRVGLIAVGLVALGAAGAGYYAWRRYRARPAPARRRRSR